MATTVKNLCQWQLSTWMAQGWMRQHVSIVSVLVYYFWYALLLWYYCGKVVEKLVWTASRIFHSPFLISIGPWINIWLLCFVFTCCDFNTAVYPGSQRLPIETNELCLSLFKVLPSHASSGKSSESIKRGLIYCMVFPFGHPALMDGSMFVYGWCV